MPRGNNPLVFQDGLPKARHFFRPHVCTGHDSVLRTLWIIGGFRRVESFPAKFEALVHITVVVGIVVAAEHSSVAFEVWGLSYVQLGRSRELSTKSNYPIRD